MIKIYTCPVCNGTQRIILDPKTNENIPYTRCLYHGCKSYNIEMELGLGFSDKVIMMKHGISRTTLWRRKKELEEWKRKNRNMF